MGTRELAEYRIFQTGREMEKALSTLQGILDGIACDKQINERELHELKYWANHHSKIFYPEPLDSILHLVIDAIDDGVLTEEEFHDISWACNQAATSNNRYDPKTISIQVLHGIMHGILSDGIVNDDEVGYLLNWLSDFDFLKGSYPYDELDSLITSILSDNKVSEDEREVLKLFFSEFVLPDPQGSISPEEISALRKRHRIVGICATCPDLVFSDRVFCFTGVSSKCKRKEIAQIISAHGGSYNDSLNSNTDYLIIGNEGNPCFAYSCYGRKVEKAVNLRKSGGKIILVHENDLWDALVDASP